MQQIKVVFNTHKILMSTLESIRELLSSNGAVFEEMCHSSTPTSEDSARERGESLEIGGKALLMSIGDGFALFVVSAIKKLDIKRIKEITGYKKVKLATVEQLKELTGGLVPGSVPPFGRPLFSYDIYVDVSVTQNSKIAFNAGSLTNSIIMNTSDYLRIAQPEILSFSMP